MRRYTRLAVLSRFRLDVVYWPQVETSRLRIGELSRRSGVSPELLRAWERRYGLLDPVRSPGGLRLYSLGDLERVRVMQQNLAEGLAAAEAAAAAVRAAAEDPSTAHGSGAVSDPR